MSECIEPETRCLVEPFVEKVAIIVSILKPERTRVGTRENPICEINQPGLRFLNRGNRLLTFPLFRGHPVTLQPSSLCTRTGNHSRESGASASDYRMPQ